MTLGRRKRRDEERDSLEFLERQRTNAYLCRIAAALERLACLADRDEERIEKLARRVGAASRKLRRSNADLAEAAEQHQPAEE